MFTFTKNKLRKIDCAMHAKGMELVKYETLCCTSLKQTTVQREHVRNPAPTCFYHKIFYLEFNISYVYIYLP